MQENSLEYIDDLKIAPKLILVPDNSDQVCDSFSELKSLLIIQTQKNIEQKLKFSQETVIEIVPEDIPEINFNNTSERNAVNSEVDSD